MNMQSRYVVKGMNAEKVIDSVITISVNDAGKIDKVQDKWNGSLPEGGIANVSPLSPTSWVNYWFAWGFWAWSFVWYTRPWMVRCAALIN